MRAQLWPLNSWSAWAQSASVLAGTTVEGAFLVSILSVSEDSGSHWGAGTIGECAPLASVRLVGFAQTATVVASKTGDGAPLASDRLVGMGSASHCGGGHYR